ncbi:MAG TPA: DinB family protein [Thermoanaerobaculia bacterium]|nr:DinB family protein [Thermoanaerobaculia bacterium]
MLIRDDLADLYAYNAWANDRMIASVETLSEEEYARVLGGGWPSVADTLAHLASATRAWDERFAGRSPERLLTAADLPRREEAVAMLRAADTTLAERVRESSAADREKILAYTNLQGKTKRVPVWAVFRHAVNHASYHRGQIASMVRMLGKEPKATDLVFWAIVNTSPE